MTLVKASANINVVGSHLKCACSAHRSLIRRTSRVVLYSSHVGIAVLVAKSKRDLQSVVMIARLSCLKPSGGHLQLNSGTSKHPQRSRIQLSRSTLWLMEKASAEMVDLTTLEIFFEDQIKGDSGPLRF